MTTKQSIEQGLEQLAKERDKLFAELDQDDELDRARKVRPYPHEGGCVECRRVAVCNYCGKPAALMTRCTNGRCRECHSAICTPGGITSPGHNYGKQGGKHFV